MQVLNQSIHYKFHTIIFCLTRRKVRGGDIFNNKNHPTWGLGLVRFTFIIKPNLLPVAKSLWHETSSEQLGIFCRNPTPLHNAQWSQGSVITLKCVWSSSPFSSRCLFSLLSIICSGLLCNVRCWDLSGKSNNFHRSSVHGFYDSRAVVHIGAIVSKCNAFCITFCKDFRFVAWYG